MQPGLNFTIKVEIEFESDFEFKSELGLEFGGVSKMEFELDFEFLFQPGLKFTLQLEFEPEFDLELKAKLTRVEARIRFFIDSSPPVLVKRERSYRDMGNNTR